MKETFWIDLEIEMILRIEKLDLKPHWRFFMNSMIANFMYAIRKAIEDSSK